MGDREAIKMVADALKAQLPGVLATLQVYAGEAAPQSRDFRDCYTHDVLDPRDYPACITDLQPTASPTAALGSQGGALADVPIEVRWQTRDLDSARARVSVAYALRGILHVLNTVLGTSANGVQLMQLTRLTYTPALDADDKLVGLVRFTAQMRDNQVQ